MNDNKKLSREEEKQMFSDKLEEALKTVLEKGKEAGLKDFLFKLLSEDQRVKINDHMYVVSMRREDDGK